jgi:hypothetical protein
MSWCARCVEGHYHLWRPRDPPRPGDRATWLEGCQRRWHPYNTLGRQRGWHPYLYIDSTVDPFLLSLISFFPTLSLPRAPSSAISSSSDPRSQTSSWSSPPRYCSPPPQLFQKYTINLAEVWRISPTRVYINFVWKFALVMVCMTLVDW